jgi:hypothetical protein
MPVFAEAFGYTPTEFRAITYRDYVRLVRHLNERAK